MPTRAKSTSYSIVLPRVPSHHLLGSEGADIVGMFAADCSCNRCVRSTSNLYPVYNI